MRVAGATLVPAGADTDLFELEFAFHHTVDGKTVGPSIDLSASGWVFSKNGTWVALATKVTPAQWTTADALLPISGKVGKLPQRLLQAIFDGLLTLPRSGDIALGFKPLLTPDQRLEWQFKASAATGSDPRDGFSLSVGKPNASAKPDHFAKTAIVAASTIAVWRDRALEVVEGDPQRDPGPFDVDAGEDQGTGYVTHAEMLDPRQASHRTVLAEHQARSTGGVGISCPIISEFTILGKPWLRRYRTVGEKNLAVASVGIRGDFLLATSASIKGYDEPLIEGPFPVSGPIGLIHHVGDSDRGMVTKLTIEQEKLFAVASSFGTLTVGAPEERRQDSNTKREVPAVRITARSHICIDRFEIAARLYDVPVALPASTYVSAATSPDHFARLDFQGGASVTFSLHALGDEAAASATIGRIFLGYSSGAPKADNFSGPPFSVPMEQACLHLVRTTDLIALKYRFAGLDLVNDGTALTLAPRGLASVALVGGRETPPAKEESRPRAAEENKPADGQTVTTTAPPLAGPTLHDPRPMLIVELPPQHRAEQAFFQRRKTRPAPRKLPTVLRPIPAVRAAANVLHESYVTATAGNVRELIEARTNTRVALLKALLATQDENQRNQLAALEAALKKFESVKPMKLGNMAGQVGKDPDVQAFLVFAQEFLAEGAEDGLPAEQTFYAGREFLDPAATLTAEQVESSILGSSVSGEAVSAAIDLLPVEPVPEDEQKAIALNYGKPTTDKNVKDEIRRLRDARSPGYTEFMPKFDTWATAFLAAEPVPADFVDIISGNDTRPGLKPYPGREYVRQIFLWLNAGADTPEEQALIGAWADKFAKALTKWPDLKSDDTEAIVRPVASRLSGPSRLAFRINTDDYETGKTGGVIPFTIDDLTNFSRFELQVVRRAQKLFRANANGTRRPLWDREEDLELADMLVHQGFSRGGLGRLKAPDGGSMEQADWVDPKQPRSWPEARVSVDQRLAEVAASSTAAPTELETAIEMPFRLMLSPSQDALFRTPRGVPAELFDQKTEGMGPTRPAMTALWTAELDRESRAHLRAVWSPDFRPEAFLPTYSTPLEGGLRQYFSFFPRHKSRSNRSPVRGPYAPWAIGRHLSSADLAGAAIELRDHRFRTSLDAFDRHELVALSSLQGLPVMGRVALDGSRIGKDQREPPLGFQISLLGTPASDVDALDYNDVYVPPPLNPEGLELALSSLGGYLTVNASFEPPAAIVDHARGALFDSLSIERWRHTIVLGRDISAEVVYKGYLMPFGIRAALIKSTERVFEKSPGRNSPVAVLRQRMFIRIANPDKEYPAFRQPDEGRRVPFRKIKLLTTQTPDISDPFDLAGTADATGVWPGGLIDLKPRDGTSTVAPPGLPFWPRTARRPGGEVMFELLLDDTIKVRMPMVFVDNVTANNEGSLAELCSYYNKLGAAAPVGVFAGQSHLAKRPLFGQKLTFAPSLEEGDTQFETETLTFGVEGRRTGGAEPAVQTYVPSSANANFRSDAFMQGADQPPFYPAMHRASIRVAQIDRMTGIKGDPVTVGFDSTYALEGFDAPDIKSDMAKNERSIFLAFAKPVDMKFGNAGDRGGAVARPELNVVALSRSTGPISFGKEGLPPPKNGTQATSTGDAEFVPVADNLKKLSIADLLPEKAKILGLISIRDAVQLAAQASGIELDPKLQEIVEFGGATADGADTFIRENVLQPLHAALAEFNNRVDTIEFQGVKGDAALKKIYPEVHATLGDFKKSIANALGAPPPSAGIESSIKAYSGVASSGRRFVRAIERAARDPVTPIREALRKIVEAYVADLTASLTTVLKQIRDIIDPAAVRGKVITFVKSLLLQESDNLATALAHLVFSVPAIDEKWSAKAEAATARGLERALATAIRHDRPWSVELNKPIFAIDRFAIVFADAIEAEIAAVLLDVEQSLRAKVEKWLRDRAADIKAEVKRVEGALWDFAFQTLNDFAVALKPLAELSTEKIDDLARELQKVGAAMAKALNALEKLRSLADAFAQRCGLVVETIDGFARTILPIDKVVATAEAAELAGCLPSFDWKACSSLPDAPALLVAISSVVRLADGIDLLVAGGSSKLDRLIRSVDHLGQGDVDRAISPLFELQKYLNGPRSPHARIVEAKASLTNTSARLVELIRRYNKSYLAHKGDLLGACSKPMVLFNELIAPIKAADAERRKIINDLLKIKADIAQLFRLVTEVKLAIDNVEEQDVSPPPLLDKLLYARFANPDPDKAPKDWAWDAKGLEINETVYQLETAKKEILGTILPVLHSASWILADLTSAAGYAKNTVDQLRKDAKDKFIAKVDELSKAATGAISQNLGKLRDQLGDLNGLVKFGEVITRINDIEATWNAKLKDVNDALKNPTIPLSSITDLKVLFEPIERQPPIEDLVKKALLDAVANTGNELLENVTDAIEARLTTFLWSALADWQEVSRKIEAALLTHVTKIVGPLATAVEKIREQRDKIVTDSMSGGGMGSIVAGEVLIPLLVVCAKDPEKPLDDLLKFQADKLKEIHAALPAPDAWNKLGRMLVAWERNSGDCKNDPLDGANAVVLIARQVVNAIDALIQRDFSRIIDLGVLRRLIEDRLKQLIPTRITLAYDLDVPLKSFEDIFIPAGDGSARSDYLFPGLPQTNLTLRARTVIDLLKPASPRMDVTGVIGPFAVGLVGESFDVITLKFDGARFGSETGGKLKTKITGVELGEMVAFLDQFSQYFSFGGDGFYLAFRWDLPGIEAGYRMPPIYLTLGALNISNLSLNASCILPFTDGEAIFKVGLSRPESPFSITSTIYGGAGHLALYANAKGIIGFTASMEFGAIVDFRLGPVTGRGQITAGIYIRSLQMTGPDGKAERVSTIEGVFTAAGSASIAMFRISAMLQVRVGQQPSGGMAGSAVFVFSFSLGLKDIEFRFVIFKQESKGFGGGGLSGDSAGLDLPGYDDSRRIRFADNGIDSLTVAAVPPSWKNDYGTPEAGGPLLKGNVPALDTNFKGYFELFSKDEPWMPL